MFLEQFYQRVVINKNLADTNLFGGVNLKNKK